MKILKQILFVTLFLLLNSCDNNDDMQDVPNDGFTVNNTFNSTENAYITIDQSDRDNNNKPDYYTFFFTNGRITDTWGDQGIGYAHAFSTNSTKLVKLQVFESNNPNLATGINAGSTYTISNTLTTSINGIGITNSGFSNDSFVAYSLQPGNTVFGTINNFDFTQIPEVIGFWHYPNTTSSSTITINAINIDTNTPANSSINIDYIFTDTNGDQIIGHYEGTLGVILD